MPDPRTRGCRLAPHHPPRARRHCSNNTMCLVSDFPSAEAKTCNTHLQLQRQRKAAAKEARRQAANQTQHNTRRVEKLEGDVKQLRLDFEKHEAALNVLLPMSDVEPGGGFMIPDFGPDMETAAAACSAAAAAACSAAATAGWR